MTRVSLASAAEVTFAPAGISRVSLAWWDPTETEGRRDPILVQHRSGLRTFVVVWPTDRAGNLIADRVRQGVADVMPWDLSAAHVERLRELARAFPLDRHDLLVGTTIWPTAETLRTMPLGFDLTRRIDAAVQLVAA